ncbi:hypothetical protein ACP4OV_031747 [Aristida adscensionis]
MPESDSDVGDTTWSPIELSESDTDSGIGDATWSPTELSESDTDSGILTVEKFLRGGFSTFMLDEETKAKLYSICALKGNKEAVQGSYQGDYDVLKQAATVDNMDPSHPLSLEKFSFRKVDEWMAARSASLAKYMPNDIIMPDPTPKSVRDAFRGIYPRLELVLEKDSVRCFMRLFSEYHTSMVWNLSITSETLTCMIRHNALRCAKVVLEGKAPKLNCMHANPNCMNPCECFPLHEAAEQFSVDMIKLLFRHGASANVRTSSEAGIEGLLPLHVAVENTCMHKYLEDILSPTQNHRDYIYKIIHLLCLPEMKLFLDTIRLLAEKTDNLVDELLNYMKGGKLVQAAVLLLAAQKHIRDGGQSDGFYTMMGCIFESSAALIYEKGDTEEAQKHLEEKQALYGCAFQLVSIISRAGEALNKYIQSHSEVKPHVEVVEHVSTILQKFGFCPKKEKYIDFRNLTSDRELPYKGCAEATEAVTETSDLHAAEKYVRSCSIIALAVPEQQQQQDVVRKKVPRGWDSTYASFFPHGRSVLGPRHHVRVYSSTSYAVADDQSILALGQLHNSWSNSMMNSFLGGLQQLTRTQKSRRYSNSPFKALAKVLKNA